MFATHTSKLALFALLLASLVLTTGCDNAGANEEEEGLTVEGRATDSGGYSKSSSSIEGAVVTAASVNADGSQADLSASATTDAEGRFSLQVGDVASNVLLLQAEKLDFSSKALVYLRNGDRASVRAMPMTSESRAEADVYVQARQQSSTGAATVADVAAYVDARVAAEMEAEQTTSADVALAVRSAAEAEAAYVRERESSDRVADGRGQKRGAFAALQTELHTASGASAQAEAVEAFEEQMARAYAEAGASAEVQAEASLAGRAALVQTSANVSADARLALRRRAEVIAALATTNAVEARFKAEGATEAQMETLTQARAALLTALRAAASAEKLAEAHAAYRASVEAELGTAFDLSATALTAAQASLAATKQALSASLDTANSAATVAKAYTTFYAGAHASAKTNLDGNAKAEAAATVLVLLSAQ